MFDDGEGRRRGGQGDVPEWAFTGSMRLEAAADRRADLEVGAVASRLASLSGGPALVALIASVIAPDQSGAGPERDGAHDDPRHASPVRDDDSPSPDDAAEAHTVWASLDHVDAASLVELVAAFERVARWARAGAARSAVELSQRPETRPPWPAAAGVVAEQCTAATDLSLRLGVTRHAARTMLHVGQTMAGPMRQTGVALESGLIDWDKARALVELLDDVPLAVCVEVEAAVLPAAGALTCPQLVRAAQRELLRVDHRDAAERNVRARTRRHVSRPRVLPDGMAAMTAVLPAEAAVRLDACLQAAAVSARGGGDGRTTDQLRADALDVLARTAWGTGWIGIPAVPDHSSTHAPAAPEAGAGSATTPFTTGGGTAMRLAQNAGRGTLISVTVGLGTLLGIDDRPGELAGFGPVGADVARMLATEGTWRRLVVDEVSGTLLDVDRRHYRPPAGIVDHVRTRNRTCVFPTCSVPAVSCQMDHTVPFPHGPTSADNLGPVCAQHHQIKTHGGFRLRQPSPGSFVVQTPTGHLYLQLPDRLPGVPAHDDVSPAWDDPPVPGSEGRDGAEASGTAEDPTVDDVRASDGESTRDQETAPDVVSSKEVSSNEASSGETSPDRTGTDQSGTDPDHAGTDEGVTDQSGPDKTSDDEDARMDAEKCSDEDQAQARAAVQNGRATPGDRHSNQPARSTGRREERLQPDRDRDRDRDRGRRVWPAEDLPPPF